MQVSLWHPATSTVDEVRAWREVLIQEEIQQPLKQAYREIYILTDAEKNTTNYSNRMAAHLLKLGQFNSLAKTRGWKFSPPMWYNFDDFENRASVEFPDYNLSANFIVNAVDGETDNNNGLMSSYLSTDRVIFYELGTTDPIELVEVPVIAFSEIMRDVDLFVGVSSVGNDPNWHEMGAEIGFPNYWGSYSFGDFGQIAKTRKEILTRMLPSLKIKEIAHIDGKFLVVKGKLRTYKIHLGSSNILMEPNDEYLCIVPDRAQKTIGSNVFLPFDGDKSLSVILSKAFLLAEDDKITDSSILSQINGR